MKYHHLTIEESLKIIDLHRIKKIKTNLKLLNRMKTITIYFRNGHLQKYIGNT